MKKQLHKIILASTSPRRKDLLSSIGLTFEVVPSNYEEDMTLPLLPEELTIHLSKEKALAIADRYPDAVIIGADTIIAFDEKVLGKAHTKEEVQRMLALLSGKKHSVVTGLTVIIPASIAQTQERIIETYASKNRVHFKTITQDEINWYIATGEPFGKAGGYAIQGFGAVFVNGIEGNYSGIVGLPVEAVYSILRSYDVFVL